MRSERRELAKQLRKLANERYPPSTDYLVEQDPKKRARIVHNEVVKRTSSVEYQAAEFLDAEQAVIDRFFADDHGHDVDLT